MAKATRAAGVEALDIAGVTKIDTTRVGQHDGSTLTEASRGLRAVAAGPVVLMVDEARHALTTPRGENTMTALKSARDTINAPGEANRRLVMTGSDRDKLSRLANGLHWDFVLRFTRSHRCPLPSAAVHRLDQTRIAGSSPGASLDTSGPIGRGVADFAELPIATAARDDA